MHFKIITLENIDKVLVCLSQCDTVLYGAGSTGIQIYDFLFSKGISISYFIDDDVSKQGKEISKVRIVSYEALKEIYGQQNKFNVIISSIYAKAILQRLDGWKVNIFIIDDSLIDARVDDRNTMMKLSQNIDEWNIKWYKISKLFGDSESLQVWNMIKSVVNKSDYDKKNIWNVTSQEIQYFPKDVFKLLNKNSVLVDCGAYTGDIIGKYLAYKLPHDGRAPVKKLYLLEANPGVFQLLVRNITAMGVAEWCIPLQVAVYDKIETLNFLFEENDLSAGTIMPSSATTKIKIQTETLDGLFEEQRVDYLKMDIEGAELSALKGAQYLLRNSQPILAISIYHSFDDFVDIPLFLAGLLEKYTFFLRHHSYGWGETVLYGIPKKH